MSTPEITVNHEDYHTLQAQPENSTQAKPSLPEKSVYGILATHQKTENWEAKEIAQELHRWAGIFDLEFKLQIPEISLSVDWLRCGTLGHFRYGHNGFGLRGELAINRIYIDKHGFWQVLGTLLHELLHGWQQAYGKSGKRNYHNKQYREKAKSLGLIVDQRGHTQYEKNSQFIEVLKKYGVKVPHIPEIVLMRRGNSKLKKWSCGCCNVRVAIPDFKAQCLQPGCGNMFELVD